jgi:hypothetical protein
MSNARAIAAVTATLQAILGNVTSDPDLSDTQFTTLPLDKARGANTSNQLNLFLYQILPNAAWRNLSIPGAVKPGEVGLPPLPLDLHYLISVFGREHDNTQPFDHHLMGNAMSLLHDHALLGPDEISLAFPGSELERQVERVRITLQPLSIEELSKLWTGFATQYRLSVGYEVSVALIESTQSMRSALPVLTQGKQNRGPATQGDLVPPFPALSSIALPNRQPSARLGDVLTLGGSLLSGTNVGVVFNHPSWSAPVEVAPQPGGTSTLVSIKIPNSPATWPAGLYSLSLFVQLAGESYRRETNRLSFSLAPSVALAPPTAPAGAVALTLNVSPQILPAQQVLVLVDDQPVSVPAITAPTASLSVTANLGAGDHYVRLRVDGVDSLLVNRALDPPVFDPTQKVVVT